MTHKNAIPYAILAAAALFVMAAVAPEPVAAAEVVCRANYDYCVEVNGAYPPDARFLPCETRGKHLIDIPSQAKSFFIDMPTRRAVSVSRDAIKPDGADGVVKVTDPGGAGAPAYALSIEGPVLRFDADTSKVRILKVTERAALVGTVTIEALAADRPEYREGIKAYKPDPVAIEGLRKNKKPIEIEAFFGTWCPHCKEYMPKFLRVLQDAANPDIKLTLVGMPRTWGDDKEPGPWQGKNFQNVPTIIIRYEGRELTRMSAHPGAVPELDLATLLATLK